MTNILFLNGCESPGYQDNIYSHMVWEIVLVIEWQRDGDIISNQYRTEAGEGADYHTFQLFWGRRWSKAFLKKSSWETKK